MACFTITTIFRKVLSKLNYCVPTHIIQKVVECKPEVVEIFLLGLMQKLELHLIQTKASQVSLYPQSLNCFVGCVDPIMLFE